MHAADVKFNLFIGAPKYLDSVFQLNTAQIWFSYRLYSIRKLNVAYTFSPAPPSPGYYSTYLCIAVLVGCLPIFTHLPGCYQESNIQIQVRNLLLCERVISAICDVDHYFDNGITVVFILLVLLVFLYVSTMDQFM